MISHKKTLTIVSFVFIGLAISYLVCIPYAVYFHESVRPFLLPALIMLPIGFLIRLVSGKSFDFFVGNKVILITILLSWLVFILAGTLSFLISRTTPSFVDALFESTSGFTSNGTSVFTNIDHLPVSIIFWRSLTHWVGGWATILMLIALFPLPDIGGYKLFAIDEHETHGIRALIYRVSLIYGALTFVQIIVFYALGMSLFNSLCYSFGTVSTGCFSPTDTGIASYPHVIHVAFMIFMFLSGISYLFYYRLVFKKLKNKKVDGEIKTYLILIATGTLIVFLGMKGNHQVGNLADTIRKTLFQIISVVSSSGYSISKFSVLPDIVLTILFLYLLVGGCSNSPTGGIKVSRFLILLQNIRLQFKSPDSPANISEIKYNGSNIGSKANLSVLTFITVFGATFVLGAIAMSFFGYGLKESAFLSVSALSAFGHNLDISHLSNAGKLILTLLMVLGRLEIYPLLITVIPQFYMKDSAEFTKEGATC